MISKIHPFPIQPHLTAGAKSLKAQADTAKYDGREVAEAQMFDISNQLYKSAHAHLSIIDEPTFYVIMVRASDPLIYGLVRQKFYCYPYMPSPRPEQAVWEYTKAGDTMKFLWSLPPAKVMAAISEATNVAKKWISTKRWCDAFFKLKFWECIREQHGSHHVSELEYLNRHREEIKKASGDRLDSSGTESFDFTKVMFDKVIGSEKPVVSKKILNSLGES